MGGCSAQHSKSPALVAGIGQCLGIVQRNVAIRRPGCIEAAIMRNSLYGIAEVGLLRFVCQRPEAQEVVGVATSARAEH